MGMHTTIHGKTVESFNGQSGKWVPIKVEADGSLSIALLAGELQQFNRTAAGPIVEYAVVTSDATGLNVASGPAILYGLIRTSASGDIVGVYNGVTATGDVVIGAATDSVAFAGMGVICDTGITVDWTSGTWLVLYVPQV